MSSLIRSWTEGSRQPACPVIAVLVYDLLICLLTPLYFITTLMLILTSKPAEDVFGGDNGGGSEAEGYIATREPEACARVSIIFMVNFVAMEGVILMVSTRNARTHGVGRTREGRVRERAARTQQLILALPSLPV